MNKKLKIAIIGSRGYPYVYSGYETLVKEISERIVKKGHKVRIYCHSPLFKKKPKYVNGIELIYTPAIETKFLSQLVNSFFSFIHVCFSRVDVVLIVNSANGPFGILTKIFNKKTCINVDGLEWLRPKWKGLGSIYFKFSSFLSTILFDQIITDSQEMNKIYLKKFKQKSRIIAYGSTMYRDIKYDFKDFNLVENEYYLIVGRLVPDNNSHHIIKGFLASKSNKKLVIVGDVPYKDDYAKNVKKLACENVIFLGHVRSQKKLSRLYKFCYAYVHGHEYGGTNPTMINALDFNCNILALNTIFNSEMLEKKKCILFDKNLISIKNKFNYFEKKYALISKQNIKYKFPKKYNWKYITNEYLNLFYKVTNSQNM